MEESQDEKGEEEEEKEEEVAEEKEEEDSRRANGDGVQERGRSSAIYVMQGVARAARGSAGGEGG